MAKKATHPSRLVVTQLEVRDVLGARHFAIEPGQITVLKGRNGCGKTSPIEALKAAIGGGNLAKLARVGAPGEEVEPEVVLVLEGDGAESYRVEKSGNKTARVRARVGDTQAFEEVPRPQEWLRSLYDLRGSNPVAYLTAKDDERAVMLLEALTLKLDRSELEHILGLDAKHVPMLPTDMHPLEELELIRDAIFRARTGVNVNARGKADAADQTRRKLPAEIPVDQKVAIATLDGEVQALATEVGRVETQADADEGAAITAATGTYAREEQRLKDEFRTEAQKLRRAHEAKAAELRAKVERQIAALNAETDRVVDALNGSIVEQIDAAEKAKDEAVAEARRQREAARFQTEAKKRDLAARREQLASLRAQAQESAAVRALQQQAEQFEQEASDLKAESERMTETINALDAFRRRLADNLPIPGLSIEGKTIKVNGIPFDQLNTQQRIDIAVRVATLRSKDMRLPLCFVDGAEALDKEHFDALVQRLEQEGVQAFIARVEDRDFEVEKIGEAVTA